MKKQTPSEKLAEAARAVSPDTLQDARNTLSDVADILARVITYHRSSTRPLTLPDGAVASLVEAQQNLYMALRKIEVEL